MGGSCAGGYSDGEDGAGCGFLAGEEGEELGGEGVVFYCLIRGGCALLFWFVCVLH